MSDNEKFTGLEKIDLAEIDLHGPIEVTLSVYLKLPDGRVGSMGAVMQPGQIPTRAAVKEVLDTFANVNGEIPGAPVGAKLLTRSEFVAHITKRELGAPFLMPTDAKFAPVPTDIPHQMLVHAVCGMQLPENSAIGKEFVARSLAVERGYSAGHGDTRTAYLWATTQVEKLPDDMLLAIYQRLVAA